MSSTTTDVTEAIKKVNSYFNDEMPKLWEDEEGLPKATISVYKKVATNVKKTLEGLTKVLIPIMEIASAAADAALQENKATHNKLEEASKKIELTETSVGDTEKLNWATNSLARSEIDSVRNTVIIRTENKLNQKTFKKDVKEEYKNTSPQQKTLKDQDIVISKIKNPSVGQHCDKHHYRVSLKAPYSKKALFSLMRKKGTSSYKDVQVRNEIPAFLYNANQRAGLIAAEIRQKSNKDIKTRISVNSKEKSIDLQVAVNKKKKSTNNTNTNNDEKDKYVTIASSEDHDDLIIYTNGEVEDSVKICMDKIQELIDNKTL